MRSVPQYLAQFRNITLALPDMTEEEKLDKSVQGLKREIRVEVLKSTAKTFEEISSIALRVDNAIWTSNESWKSNNNTASNGVIPMEIGNLESNKDMQKSQRQIDLDNNACFICHKPGCRLWKHNVKQTSNL